MKNLLRLALSSAFLLASLAISSQPAAARLACENLHWRACSSTLTPACAWGDGVWGRCVCESGRWNCAYEDGLG
ncbi:MAG TPA: hypothetical protein VF789_00195 [Thermoanaerobaculia bacterium]